MQQQLNETVFKKIIKQPIIQPTPPEIIPNVPKTEDFFIDDDEFYSFKKPEPTTINIGQPQDDDGSDLIIFDYDEVKLSKSLIETDNEIKNKNSLKWKKIKNRKTYKKQIAKQNLQDTLNYVFSDLETVNYKMIKHLMTLKS